MDTPMSVRQTARRQYARIIDGASKSVEGLSAPREGWIATMRKALGMSAPQLARRAQVSKAAIYQAERKEREGGITIRQMEKLAASLGGRFVYAIVPGEGDIRDHVLAQARAKAGSIVRRASSHMALENQSLPDNQVSQEIERLTHNLARDMPPGLWDKA